MGNYFSRQGGDESIKEAIIISNEIDHVRVTVSNTTSSSVTNTNENHDEKNETETIQECSDKVDVVNFLKPQIKMTHNELDNKDNNYDIIYKKNLKKRKCKKNKKKRLQ
jgi:hypothetical protein